MALRPDGMDEAGLLQQQRDLQHVRHALAHRDDALGDHGAAEFGVRLGRGVEQREFADGLLAVLDEGGRQRPRVAQFAREQRDPRLLVQRQIGHAGHRRVDQFGDGALVHGGILPDVEAGEVEAEAIHRAAQQPQPPARDHAGIVRDQRAVENIEIGLELARHRRKARLRRPARRVVPTSSFSGGRGEPRVNAGHRQAIRLAAAMRRLVGRALGEHRANPWTHRPDAPPATVRRRAHAIPPDRSAAPGSTAVCSVPRITSAVTNGLPSRSPPIQLPILRNEASSSARGAIALVQPVLQRAMQPRHLVQEGVVVERQAVGDLVEHGELGPAQQIGLPQRQHGAAQLLVAGLSLFRRAAEPVRGGPAAPRSPSRGRSCSCGGLRWDAPSAPD